MLEALTDIQVSTLVAALAGVLLGYVVGSLPGLTATMTIALLLPFSFGLTTLDSIVLMAAVFIGSMNGGTLAACMYNIPGTPSAAATVLDGYPLTQQGKFGKAVSIATIGSFVGTTFSIIVLIWFSPILAGFAIRFSAPEYLALALFGLSIVASVAGKSIVKGVLAASFGVIVSMVGQDPITAFPRFTFGTTTMLHGFSFIPVLIGLFGISEVLKQAMPGNQGNPPLPTITRQMARLVTVKETVQQLPNMLRSSAIGTVIGAVPGTGGVAAAFLSYREAKRASKHPEEFGRGSLAGVAAPESGNNAVTGGVMIPLLTLGIPGDAASAVMLGAFLIHGLQPGPQLFVNSPELVNGLFVGMLIASVFMLVQGLTFIRGYARILNLNPAILMPIITVLTVVGAYAANGSIFDVVIMFVFGFVGYFFYKADVPFAPLVLGLVLGPLVESNLRRALIQHAGSYEFLYTRPITVVILALAVLSIASSAWSEAKARRRAEQPGDAGGRSTGPGAAGRPGPSVGDEPAPEEGPTSAPAAAVAAPARAPSGTRRGSQRPPGRP